MVEIMHLFCSVSYLHKSDSVDKLYEADGGDRPTANMVTIGFHTFLKVLNI